MGLREETIGDWRISVSVLHEPYTRWRIEIINTNFGNQTIERGTFEDGLAQAAFLTGIPREQLFRRFGIEA